MDDRIFIAIISEGCRYEAEKINVPFNFLWRYKEKYKLEEVIQLWMFFISSILTKNENDPIPFDVVAKVRFKDIASRIDVGPSYSRISISWDNLEVTPFDMDEKLERSFYLTLSSKLTSALNEKGRAAKYQILKDIHTLITINMPLLFLKYGY